MDAEFVAAQGRCARVESGSCEKVLTKIAQQFGGTLTKKKLGQFVPVAGMVAGAGLNYWVIDQMGDDVIDVIELLREEGALPPPDPCGNPAVGEEA